MDRLDVWLLVWILAVTLNVVPAFMPPTWALLTYFRIEYGFEVVPLALVGAFGSTTGRALLALLSRTFGERFVPARWRANIMALAEALQKSPALGLSTILLYTLGPAPSNQLFIAVGLADAPLAPVLVIFAIMRFFSYLIWVSVATAAAGSLREVLSPRLGNEFAVVVQIVGFALLILIMQIDWAKWFRRGKLTRPAPARQGSDP
jgi:membrane protein DedA with SNARE-associated domain